MSNITLCNDVVRLMRTSACVSTIASAALSISLEHSNIFRNVIRVLSKQRIIINFCCPCTPRHNTVVPVATARMKGRGMARDVLTFLYNSFDFMRIHCS
jgi:hypothetical protein